MRSHMTVGGGKSCQGILPFAEPQLCRMHQTRLCRMQPQGPSAAPIHGPAKATRESAFLTASVHDGSHRPLGSNATHPRSSEKGIFHPPRTQPRVANAPPTRWDCAYPQGGPQADSHHSVREICVTKHHHTINPKGRSAVSE